MSNLKRLVKNTLYLTLADFISPFINVILVIYISRKLGAEGLGGYAAIVAFLFLIEKFAQLGLHHIIIRDIARKPETANQYFADVMMIGLLSSVFAYMVLHGILAFVQYPSDVALSIKVLGLSIFFFVIREYCFAFFQGFQKMGYKSVVTLMFSLLRTGLGMGVVAMGWGVSELIWSLLIARVLAGVLSFVLVLHLGVRFTGKPNVKRIQKLLSQTMTFLLISFITTTYWKIDVLMLTKMKGVGDVGFYSAAYRLLDILKGLMNGYIAALFPMLAVSYASAKSAFNRQLSLSIKYLYMVTLPIAIGTTLLANDFIILIYGNDFYGSVLVLQILIWTICFFPIAIIFARALIASDRQKYDLISNVIALFINLILNFILIRRFGYIGAALATSISIFLFLLIQYSFVRKFVTALPFIRQLIKPSLAALIMGVVLFWIREWPLVCNIAVSILVYVSALWGLKTFGVDEIDMAKTLLKKKGWFVKSGEQHS